MGIFTIILYIHLIVLFCNGEGEIPHRHKTIYVPNPSDYYSLNSSPLSESQILRKALNSSHNAIKKITRRKVEGSSALEVLNLLNKQSSQAKPTTVSVNSQAMETAGLKSHKKFSQIDGKADSPQADPSLQDTTESPVPVEMEQAAEGLLNIHTILKVNVSGQDEKGAMAAPPSVLRIVASCGIPVNGVLDLSNRKLTESELREKMDPRHCKPTMDKITEFNASYNSVNMDLTALISLLLKMKDVQSVDMSYNNITINSTQTHPIWEPSKLLFLNLSHNPLKTLEKLSLPSAVKCIDLSFTHINQIPKEFGGKFAHLEEMYVQGNSFIYHAASFTAFSNLVHLNMKNEAFSYIDVTKQTPVGNLPHVLKHLEMSHCSIVELPEWFAGKMENLLFLDISDNPMNTFPQLPASLQYLELSNSHIGRLSNLSLFSNLTVLKISSNKVTDLSPKDLPASLKEFDISKNKIRLLPLQEAQQKIEFLNVSGNLIMQLNLNTSFASLTNLDASCNLITELLDRTGEFLPGLKHLNLSGNKISFLQPGSLPESLLELDISNNAITIITEETFGRLTNLNVLTVQGKHFFCNCDLYWFANMHLSSPRVQINGREGLLCSFPPNKRGLLVQNSKLTLINCSLGLQMGITACVAVLAMCSILALCWHFNGPWYIKMGWYWCMAKRNQYEKRPEHKLYDAFISYSEHDAPWTKGTLLKTLEANGFKVCYHERDFMPGHPVLGNIFYCIENSHKVIFVLSPSFVSSCWCQYELYFAEHRVLSENQDSLIMVVLEDLPPNSIPQRFSKLRKLLKRKTYLKWSPEEHKQKFFWRQLTAVLKTTNEPMVLTDKNNGLSQDTLGE